MKWTSLMVGSLCVAAIAGCKGNRGDNYNTGAVGGSDTASMQSGAAGTATDTSMQHSDSASMQPGNTGAPTAATGGVSADTARSRAAGGTPGAAKSKTGNQTKSGVTDTKTGKSTLGKGVTQTSPDQGQPVTAKGDTLGTTGDSTASAR
jgi:hypothetical protein